MIVKKWPLVVGVILSGSLFFAGGLLSGYSVGSQQKQEDLSKKTTPAHKPSEDAAKKSRRRKHWQIASKIIDRLSSQISIQLHAKARLPSNPAINKAREYENYLK
jgi:hypothetical protein